MNTKFRVSELQGRTVTLALGVLGLALILAGALINKDSFNLDIGSSLVKIGEFILVAGVVHWIFDVRIKTALFDEIARATIQYETVAHSGITGFTDNTRAIDYADLLRNSQELIIGLNYSARFLEDHIQQFKSRIREGKQTRLVMLTKDARGLKYLADERPSEHHIWPDYDKLKALIKQANEAVPPLSEGRIEILEVQNLLRYAFVWSEPYAWIKPQRNATGKTRMWAIKVSRPGPMYDFVTTDIRDLLEQNGHKASMR